MTATVTKPHTHKISAYDEAEIYDEALPCSILFRSATNSKPQDCPHVALYDAFVTCAVSHERTQHYCERCHQMALNGKVDCRTCRHVDKKKQGNCPVSVIASYPRNYK